MFTKGFEKIAGHKTEVAGAVLGGIPSVIGGVAGHLKGKYTKEEQKDADEKTWSNLLVPGAGAYRFMRRRGKEEHKHHAKK